MIKRTMVWQKFGSMKRDTLTDEEVSGEDALEEIIQMVGDGATVESYGYNELTVSTSLNEDIIFKVI